MRRGARGYFLLEALVGLAIIAVVGGTTILLVSDNEGDTRRAKKMVAETVAMYDAMANSPEPITPSTPLDGLKARGLLASNFPTSRYSVRAIAGPGGQAPLPHLSVDLTGLRADEKDNVTRQLSGRFTVNRDGNMLYIFIAEGSMLVVPTPVYPLTGAERVPYNCEFRWEKSQTATSYELEFAEGGVARPAVTVTDPTPTAFPGQLTYTRALTFKASWAWRIRARKGSGPTAILSAWSQWQTFKTVDAPVPSKIFEPYGGEYDNYWTNSSGQRSQLLAVSNTAMASASMGGGIGAGTVPWGGYITTWTYATAQSVFRSLVPDWRKYTLIGYRGYAAPASATWYGGGPRYLNFTLNDYGYPERTMCPYYGDMAVHRFDALFSPTNPNDASIYMYAIWSSGEGTSGPGYFWPYVPSAERALGVTGFWALRKDMPFSVDRVVRTSGPAAGNAYVTVYGEKFVRNSVVTFGGVPAEVRAVSSDGYNMVVYIPAHAPGTVDITVTLPDGRACTLPNAFTYV